MKRYIRCAADVNLNTIEQEIESLFEVEGIPYVYVECIDDNPVTVVAITYGDWKNDNDRADYLVEQKFHPTESFSEDKDPYDYLDKKSAARMEGSDSCVTKHQWTWKRGNQRKEAVAEYAPK